VISDLHNNMINQVGTQKELDNLLQEGKEAVDQEINSVANQGITGAFSKMMGITRNESSADII